MLEVDAPDVGLGDVPPGELLDRNRQAPELGVVEGEVLVLLLAVIGRGEAEAGDGPDRVGRAGRERVGPAGVEAGAQEAGKKGEGFVSRVRWRGGLFRVDLHEDVADIERGGEGVLRLGSVLFPSQVRPGNPQRLDYSTNPKMKGQHN